METIRINGIDTPINQIDGPDDSELREAYQRKNAQRMREAYGSATQGSGSKFIGTPRRQKHKGDASTYGVRIR